MHQRMSILLINFNRLEYLKGTVETIFATTDYPYELLIWDNASTEAGVKEYLRSIATRPENYTKVFYSPKNIGVWRASNELLSRANNVAENGFVKIDNDCKFLTKGWIGKWIECCGLNTEIGMIGANIEGKKERSADTEFLVLNGHPVLSLIEEGTGGAVYVPGRTFRQLGYYNEEYGIYGQGDKDYARRVMTLGKKFVYHREVKFERFAVNSADQVGGYREHKNLYVRRNRRLYFLNRFLYQKGYKSLAIWYDKYLVPEEIRMCSRFQWTDTTAKVDWETGRVSGQVRDLIQKHNLEGIKK